MYSFLLREASKPYYRILKAWIGNGVLEDYYNEFMIEERTSITKEHMKLDYNDVYWEQRYSIRSEWVPSFFESYKEKILLAGKYLNVLRECGKFAMPSDIVELTSIKSLHSAESSSSSHCDMYKNLISRLVEEIESAYLNANQSLLKLLWEDRQLMDRLRSLKNIFLLSQSDYLTHFLDLSIKDLLKPVANAPLPKLKALLELVLCSPSTTSSSDAFKENFTIEMSPMSLIDQLMRINSVVTTLNYRLA